MPDKRTTPDPAEGASRRKRRAPTIDLTATDVSAPAPEPDAHAAEPPRGEHPSETPESPERDGAKQWNWVAARQMFFAGFGGAVIVALFFFGVWLAGLVPARYAGPVDAGAASVAALGDRLAKIESSIAKIPASDPGLSERLSAVDNAVKSLGIALTALNKRSDEVAARADAADKAVVELRDSVQGLTRNTSSGLSPADVEGLQKRLATLEQAVRSTTGDTAARLALTAAALRDAVVRGVPFTAEFEEARALGADEKHLAPLASFAASGVPSAAILAQELRASIPALAKASDAHAPSGDFLDRLQANASKLVRIRPVGTPAGDDPSAVLARIEVETGHADIDGALSDLGKLDATTRALVRDWIAKAQSRQAAITAARRFAADTMHALAKR
ncbi:MAG TPA: hypothetical protein VFL53_05835 [Pseudolabrys sp.]|nr:hypothetical protein [Pseudolabrys sp.]